MTLATRFFSRLWGLSPAANGVRLEADIVVPARDGVALLTDIYHPVGKDRPPAILLRSPYGRGSAIGLFGRLFAERGYTVVIQSTRGTFGSGGLFNPFFQERDDGLAAVDWIERQSWYGGKLGLWGASYLGQVQWAIAAELGDRIAAMAIVRSASDFAEAIWEGDGLRLEDFLSWTAMMQIQETANTFAVALGRQVFGDPLRRHYAALPLGTIDERAAGRPVDFWRTWMAHDDPSDPYWAPLRNRGAMDRVTAPVSLLAGWSDLFINHQIHDYAALRAAGKTVRLTVDPGTHSSFGSVGGSVVEALDWFDIHLNGRAPQAGELSRVRVWMNGANAWREDVTWPGAGARSLRLTADGGLSESAPPECQRAFTYDPDDPTPSLAGATLSAPTGRGDMRPLAARADVLSFIGAPLGQALEIVGEPQLTLTLSADGAFHDLFACLADVDPAGKSTNITDGYRRLPACEPGAPRTVTIPLLPASWRVAAGHRLQLLIAGGAFPRYARNLGFGEPAATAVRTRKTAITVHCGPSALDIPIPA